MTYTPDEIWPIPGGFCGAGTARSGGRLGGRLRGFDLVILRGGEIALNEVYVHQLPA